MRCSKCWLREKGCLTATWATLVDCATIGDRPCRAMRAVMKLARRATKALDTIGHDSFGVPAWRYMCDERKCPDGKRGPRGPLMDCPECLARWATR